MTDHKTLLIGSYNARGSQNKQDYIGTLLNKVDIMCIQEH